MHATSLAMGRLSILHLLLLLLGLGPRAPQAQGQPLGLTTCSIDECRSKIKEIRQLLNLASLHPKAVDPEETGILMNKPILSTNLDAFLNATNYFQNEVLTPIKENLQDFKSLLPTSKPLVPSIQIKKDWDDFRRKLNKYLDVLLQFVTERQRFALKSSV